MRKSKLLTIVRKAWSWEGLTVEQWDRLGHVALGAFALICLATLPLFLTFACVFALPAFLIWTSRDPTK